LEEIIFMVSKDNNGKIHVPDAPFRPGEEANFENWPWKPGDLSKPDPKNCLPQDTVSLANGTRDSRQINFVPG